MNNLKELEALARQLARQGYPEWSLSVERRIELERDRELRSICESWEGTL